jgi:hypothetical protein
MTHSSLDQDTEPTQFQDTVAPSDSSLGNNDVYKAVGGVDEHLVEQSQDPAALLPNDENSAWAALNPMGKGELDNINLLSAGHHIGINTVGTSRKNANLQIRSEVANPKVYVGPWNNSTIEQDSQPQGIEV